MLPGFIFAIIFFSFFPMPTKLRHSHQDITTAKGGGIYKWLNSQIVNP